MRKTHKILIHIGAPKAASSTLQIEIFRLAGKRFAGKLPSNNFGSSSLIFPDKKKINVFLQLREANTAADFENALVHILGQNIDDLIVSEEFIISPRFTKLSVECKLTALKRAVITVNKKVVILFISRQPSNLIQSMFRDSSFYDETNFKSIEHFAKYLATDKNFRDSINESFIEHTLRHPLIDLQIIKYENLSKIETIKKLSALTLLSERSIRNALQIKQNSRITGSMILYRNIKYIFKLKRLKRVPGLNRFDRLIQLLLGKIGKEKRYQLSEETRQMVDETI